MFSGGVAEAAAVLPSLLTCYAAACGGESSFTTGSAEEADNNNKAGAAAAAADYTVQYLPRQRRTATKEDVQLLDMENEVQMKRASVSRRSLHLQSPPPRSRSSERNVVEGGEEQEEHAAGGRQRVDSCDERRRAYHVRAVSDPFDSQLDDEHDSSLIRRDEDLGADDHDDQQQRPLFTLPRFPVSETRNKNCWNESPLSQFRVRGPSYFDDKTKVSSGPYLLRARGFDLFVTTNGDHNYENDNSQRSQHSQPPPSLKDRTRAVLGGQLRKLPTLAVNFQFPWGHMVLYWELSSKLVPYLLDATKRVDSKSLSVPEQVLAKWLQGSDAYKNERLKLIPIVAEGPWVVRNMVTGKPALIGKRLPVRYEVVTAAASGGGGKSHQQQQHHHHQHPLLLCTLDIGNGSSTAKRIVSVCRRYMNSLTLDIGFVVQSETPSELPEQMMGSIRVHGPDPLKAIPLR